MMRLLTFLLLLSLTMPTASLIAPSSVQLGDTIEVVVVLSNPLNETVQAYVMLVSPYNYTRTYTVPAYSEKNASIYVLTSDRRAGETVNITVVVLFERSTGEKEYVLHQDVLIETSKNVNLVSVLIGLAILTIGLSVVGYRAMARRKKKEEEEERRFERPPRL